MDVEIKPILVGTCLSRLFEIPDDFLGPSGVGRERYGLPLLIELDAEELAQLTVAGRFDLEIDGLSVTFENASVATCMIDKMVEGGRMDVGDVFAKGLPHLVSVKLLRVVAAQVVGGHFLGLVLLESPFEACHVVHEEVDVAIATVVFLLQRKEVAPLHGHLRILDQVVGLLKSGHFLLHHAIFVDEEQRGIAWNVFFVAFVEHFAVAFLHIVFHADEIRVEKIANLLLREHIARQHLARAAPRRIAVDKDKFVLLFSHFLDVGPRRVVVEDDALCCHTSDG